MPTDLCGTPGELPGGRAPSAAPTLAIFALFQGLGEEFVQDLMRVAEEHDYAEGTLLTVEGEAGDSLYLIMSGHAEVSVRNAIGQTVVLTYLGPGEFVGELSLLDGGPRSATVRVVDPSVCLRLDRVAFYDALSRRPEAALALIPTLAKRIREANSTIAALAAQLSGRRAPRADARAVRDAYRAGLLKNLE